jgi:hypothetical protein
MTRKDRDALVFWAQQIIDVTPVPFWITRNWLKGFVVSIIARAYLAEYEQ